MEKWDVVIYFLLIGGLLFVGKILKTRFLFLNRIVLPTALLGGLIGLLLSDVIIPGSFHIDVETMTAIVYHALALGFISLTLKQGESKKQTQSLDDRDDDLQYVCASRVSRNSTSFDLFFR